MKVDPAWAPRRLLLRNRNRNREALSAKGLARLKPAFATDDPATAISAGGQGAPASALGSTRSDPVQPARDRPPPDPVPRGLHHRRQARNDPPGRDQHDVVARDRSLPTTRHHQRPHRRLQPRHQADRARRLRLSQPGQLRKAHHVAQRDPPGREPSAIEDPAHMPRPVKSGERVQQSPLIKRGCGRNRRSIP